MSTIKTNKVHKAAIEILDAPKASAEQPIAVVISAARNVILHCRALAASQLEEMHTFIASGHLASLSKKGLRTYSKAFESAKKQVAAFDKLLEKGGI